MKECDRKKKKDPRQKKKPELVRTEKVCKSFENLKKKRFRYHQRRNILRRNLLSGS